MVLSLVPCNLEKRWNPFCICTALPDRKEFLPSVEDRALRQSLWTGNKVERSTVSLVYPNLKTCNYL